MEREFKGLLLLKVHLTWSHVSPLNAGNDVHGRLLDCNVPKGGLYIVTFEGNKFRGCCILI